MAQGSRVNRRAALTLPGHASKASWTRGCKSFEDKNNMVTHTHVYNMGLLRHLLHMVDAE